MQNNKKFYVLTGGIIFILLVVISGSLISEKWKLGINTIVEGAISFTTRQLWGGSDDLSALDLPTRIVTLPAARGTFTNSNYSTCREDSVNGVVNLADCLSLLVLDKKDSEKLVVQLLPGKYAFYGRGGVLIYNRKNIEIRGVSSTTNDVPEIVFSSSTYVPGLVYFKPMRTLSYFVHIINSSNITIHSLKLDASGSYTPASMTSTSTPELIRYGGVGVCSIGANAISDTINISNITAKGFLDFFMVVGETKANSSFNSEINKDVVPAGLTARLFNDLKKIPENNRYCNGVISNVQFHRNTIYMKSVGFYVNPLLSVATSYLSKFDPPYFITAAGAKIHWWDAYLSFMRSDKATRNIFAGNNKFIVDLNRSDFLQFGVASSSEIYFQQLSGYMHSAAKLQSSTNVRFNSNIIDARSNPDAFAYYINNNGSSTGPSGAAINIASSLWKPFVVSNTVLFSPKSSFGKGIILDGAFTLHPLFGMGLFSTFGPENTTIYATSTRLLEETRYGGTSIFGPTFGSVITNNAIYFGNSEISNTCGSYKSNVAAPVIWAPVYLLCKDIDANVKNYNQYTSLNSTNSIYNNKGYFMPSGLLAKPKPFELTTEAQGALKNIDGYNKTFLEKSPKSPVPIASYPLTNNTYYFYRDNNTLQSIYSGPVPYVGGAYSPVVAKGGVIQIKWVASSGNGETGYEIYRALGKVTLSSERDKFSLERGKFSIIGKRDINQNTFDDSTANVRDTYTYVVRALRTQTGSEALSSEIYYFGK